MAYAAQQVFHSYMYINHSYICYRCLLGTRWNCFDSSSYLLLTVPIPWFVGIYSVQRFLMMPASFNLSISMLSLSNLMQMKNPASSQGIHTKIYLEFVKLVAFSEYFYKDPTYMCMQLSTIILSESMSSFSIPFLLLTTLFACAS